MLINDIHAGESVSLHAFAWGLPARVAFRLNYPVRGKTRTVRPPRISLPRHKQHDRSSNEPIAAGAVFVVGVVAYNKWQEHKARKSVERAFCVRPRRRADAQATAAARAPAAPVLRSARHAARRADPGRRTGGPAGAGPAGGADGNWRRRALDPDLGHRPARRQPSAGRTGHQPGRPADRLPDPAGARSAGARRQDPADAANPAPRRQQADPLHRPCRQRRLGADRPRRRLHQAAGRRADGQPHHGAERTRILRTGHAPARRGRRDRRRAGNPGHDRSDGRSAHPAPLRRRPRRPAGREPAVERRAMVDRRP